ncbi:CPBP family intramembrane glutamic endopeptidase [Salinimicrobium soli]|uniref:CPBP family intramembrane glutamic endopeptidase n=1 Tax=Salinimicrobium soli TaxID=1254399 RepID=UPI003AAAF2BC
MQKEINSETQIPFSFKKQYWIIGLAIFANYFACRIAIPYLEEHTDLLIEVIYFLCVGGLVLLPMFLLSLILSKREARTGDLAGILTRMRVKKLNSRDLKWATGSFIFLCLASFLIAKVLMPLVGLDATPFFFRNLPLNHQTLFILYLWPIFFFFNIFGEEFFWRGYLQPRQEVLYGKLTYIVQGLFWALWHLPMGLGLVIASLPIFFVLPAVVQRTGNTSVGILVHAVFGAFGFLAVALGAVH